MSRFHRRLQDRRVRCSMVGDLDVSLIVVRRSVSHGFCALDKRPCQLANQVDYRLHEREGWLIRWRLSAEDGRWTPTSEQMQVRAWTSEAALLESYYNKCILSSSRFLLFSPPLCPASSQKQADPLSPGLARSELRVVQLPNELNWHTSQHASHALRDNPAARQTSNQLLCLNTCLPCLAQQCRIPS